MTKRTRRSPYNGKQPYQYGFRKCSHNNTHLEKTDGITYAVCDACNTVRCNHGTRYDEQEQEKVLQAA